MNKHGRKQKLRGGAKFFFAWLLLLVVSLVSLSLFAGCGDATMKTPQAPRAIRLTFSFWGSGEELAAMKTVIADFEAMHPDIEIEPVHIPDNYFQKLHILLAGDLAPDVMMVNSLYLPVYADNGAFLALRQPGDETRKSDWAAFYPQALSSMTWRGTLYAVPRDVSNLAVYVNLDCLRQHGLKLPSAHWSLEEFQRLAKGVLEPPSEKHPAGVFGVSFFEKPLFWQPWVWSFGGEVFSQDFSRFTLDSPEAIRGLQTYANWVVKDHIAPSKQQVGQQGMSQLFADGHVAFFISGRWSVPFLREKATFKWDVWPMPKGPKGSIVGIDSSGYAISAKTTHADAARLFVMHLTSARSLRALTASGLIVPSRRDLAQSAIFLNANPGQLPTHNRVFLDSIATGRPTHTPPNWDEVSERLGLGLEPVWDGRATAHDAVKSMARDITETLGYVSQGER